MPVHVAAWEDFFSIPRGPAWVERDDGTHVTYGVRAKPRRSPDGLELVVYNETGGIVRVIAGDDVRELNDDRAKGPDIIVVVENTVQPDSGQVVQTRGVSAPRRA
jgi:hypothetical protein